MKLELRGVGLHVRVAGPSDGPPLVFMHGVQSSGETYGWLPPSVTEGRRVYVLDHRGHGASDRQPGTYQLAHYFADAVAVLEQVVARPAVVVGHSLGGVLGWMLAQQRPDLVTAVLAEDPPLYYGDDAEFAASGIAAEVQHIRELTGVWRATALDDAGAARAFGALPAAGPGSPPLSEVLTDDELTAQSRAFLQVDPEVQEQAYENGTFRGVDAGASVNGVPVTILAADEAFGSVFSTVHQRRLAGTHPEVEVVRLDGATHSVKGTRRTRPEYLRLLTELLDAHAPVTAADARP